MQMMKWIQKDPKRLVCTHSFSTSPKWHSTTILALKKERKTIIIGDGQVTLG